jgi:PHP family Zn ribbon phosphoesterase
MSAGLRYFQVDLHVHTPASRCFNDRDVTADAIVQAALKENLDAIAVTDHNSPAFIDQLLSAAKGRLVVFPGVEITAESGKGGVHVLAIFDPSEGAAKVAHLLSRVGVDPDQYGEESALANPVGSVIQEIETAGGLAILAHAKSSKGAMADVQGKTRTAIFGEPGLMAVEVGNNDFSEDRKTRRVRAVDLLDGHDVNYANRKLAVIQGSDCLVDDSGRHTIDGIGRRRTYIKTTQPLTLEGLRQAFIDPDSRIRVEPLGLPPDNATHPRIARVAVHGGFFDALDLEVHEGMTSLIGGKGSGKSLLVELLRFALGSEPSQPDIAKDHEGKLERRLGRYGQVILEFIDEAGTRHRIERTYDPAGGSPYGSEDEELVAADFSCLFLSQNEIIRIAESDEEQLKFIDRFLDFRAHQRTLESLGEELEELDKSVAEALRAAEQLKQLQSQEATLERRLKSIDVSLKNPVFTSYASALAKARSLASATAQGDKLVNVFTQAEELLNAVGEPVISAGVESDPAMKRSLASLFAARQTAREALLSGREQVEKAASTSTEEVRAFAPKLAAEKAKYEKMVSESGGDYKALTAQRDDVAERLEALRRKILDVKATADELRDVAKVRAGKLRELGDAQKAFTADRQEKCSQIEAYSGGRLRLSVSEASDTTEFRRQLSEMKRGSYLQADEIEAIASRVTPQEFVSTLLNYDAASDENKGRHIGQLASKSGIPSPRVRQLADFLLESRSYGQILALQHKATPSDRPRIEFRVDDGAYEPLDSISTGQKCTALLVMALADGSVPVIIDQPEDSLDLRSIWHDMCEKLRGGKEYRQFICTTHNSSLAVDSDTDCYIVLEASATAGYVAESGAIDGDNVKAQVIDYLEGGVTTYAMKYRKYDMQHRLS